MAPKVALSRVLGERLPPTVPLSPSLDVLWEEGKAALEQLLKFMVHPAISSINLTTALGSLANIARQRPIFMSEVIQAYETLHGRLLPSPLHWLASLLFLEEMLAVGSGPLRDLSLI